ncbi:MAG: type II toxin-antitoxin system PemK/MazF family toxin [Sphingomonadaceae bacterium]|nr:type II toxin-antitoxin system PemK/MazF family toxin [Sphingomonadaceae bacterium]
MIEKLRRGDVVIGADRTDYLDKPRPMLVVQAEKYLGRVDSVTVCPIISTEIEAPLFRIAIAAMSENGLDESSFISVDKITTVRAEKVRHVAGKVSEPTLRSVDEALRRWLAL